MRGTGESAGSLREERVNSFIHKFGKPGQRMAWNSPLTAQTTIKVPVVEKVELELRELGTGARTEAQLRYWMRKLTKAAF